MQRDLERGSRWGLRPHAPQSRWGLRPYAPEGLGGALLVAVASLILGRVAGRLLDVPDLTAAATLMVVAEALGGRRRVAEDQVTARLSLVGLAGFVGLLTGASLHPRLQEHVWRAAPGILLALLCTVVLSTIAASTTVAGLRESGRPLRLAAVVTVVCAGALVLSSRRAPWGINAGAALGVLVGLVGIARSAPFHRQLAVLRGAVQGRLDGDGWISFEDGSSPVRAKSSNARGPVAVVLAPYLPRSAYRDHAEPEVVVAVAGELDRLRHQLRLEAARHDALALGAAVLMASPLIACVVHAGCC